METLPTQTAPVTQGRIIFGRNCVPWSERELAVMVNLAPKPCDRATLERLFPDRTLKASKKQLSKVREEMGCSRAYTPRKTLAGTPMLHPDDQGLDDGEQRVWRKACEQANQRYVAALARTGRVYA